MKKLGYQPYKIDGYRFQEELKKVMYTIGDDINPDAESVELMEQYLIEYVSNLVNCAHNRAQRGGSHHMQVGDLVHYLSSNAVASARIP